MKRILSALLALSAAAAVADGSPFSVSGSSGEFVVDTRSDIVITDVTSTYCSGEYGGQGGRAQTFISGVRCEISFTKHFYKPQPLRTLAENEADLRAVAAENANLIGDLLK